MAKRKKKNSLNKMVVFIPLVLGVVILGMMLLDAVKFTGALTGAESSFSGFEVMFGLTEKTTMLGTTITTEILGFSLMAVVAAILPLVGAVMQLSNNKILKLVACALSLGGAVLLFIMPNFVVFASEGIGKLYSLATASVGIGAIIAGILASLETIVIGYELLSK